MLLQQLLKSPRTSSGLLVCEPFRTPDREELVREVIGLANADVEGPRYILFGVNPGAIEGDGVVGVPDELVRDLKRAHRLVSTLVEPSLALAFTFDRINGKLVGALEIDDCEYGPYFVGQDFGESLARGQCWVREERSLREVARAELCGGTAAAADPKPSLLPEQVEISVGFNDKPDCHFLELPIPDTSNPPFSDHPAPESSGQQRVAKQADDKRTTIGQVIKETVNTVTTQILGLRHAAATGNGSDTAMTEDAGQIYADAQNHYYFEERAVRLELCIRNRGDVALEDVTIEFGFPRVPDFDVADRIYLSPFDKRSPNEIRNMGYPEVEGREDAIFARSVIDTLEPGATRPALDCPLRLAVGPGMQRRKLGIRYTLRGPDNRALAKGALKVRFGEVTD